MTQNEARAALEQRAAELRRVVEAPSERELAANELARVEHEIAAGREAEGRDAAKGRLLGIRRALGSVVSNMTADEKRVREKVAELNEAITRLNERYAQTAHLRAEAAALCDRFGLDALELPTVLAPALRDLEVVPSVRLMQTTRRLPRTEKCEHELRERRTYAEVRGSEGYQIIEAAGLQPFPTLNDKQQRVIEAGARERARTQEELARLSETASATLRALDAFPGHTGITSL